jgi:hypothetical protein
MQKKNLVYNSLERYSLSLLFFIFILTSNSCGTKSSRASDKSASITTANVSPTGPFPDDIKSKPFRNSDSTWGFTIYVNGKIYIHQQVISVPGSTSGFLTEEDAAKTSDLVIRKIKNHVSPETVSEKELDSIGIHLTKKKIK